MMGFPSGSAVKNRPAMQETQETWVRFLSWEDPLEEGMATHSSILAWRIPRSLAGYSSWSHKESDTTEQLSMRGICPLEENKWWKKIPSVPPQHNLKINTEGARSDSDPSTSWSQKAKVSSYLKGQNGQHVRKWSLELTVVEGTAWYGSGELTKNQELQKREWVKWEVGRMGFRDGSTPWQVLTSVGFYKGDITELILSLVPLWSASFSHPQILRSPNSISVIKQYLLVHEYF